MICRGRDIPYPNQRYRAYINKLNHVPQVADSPYHSNINIFLLLAPFSAKTDANYKKHSSM